MLIIYKFQGFHAFFREGYPPKNARKDTTIFFNRCYFIEKLTPCHQKKQVRGRKNIKKTGKNVEIFYYTMAKCRIIGQNHGKFPSYRL